MAYQSQRPGCHRPVYPAYGMPMPMQPVAPCKASCEEMDVPKPCKCRDKGMDMNIDDFPVGMCYVPWQTFHTTYELPKAFQAGTIFPELDLRFTGRCSK